MDTTHIFVVNTSNMIVPALYTQWLNQIVSSEHDIIINQEKHSWFGERIW